VTPCRCSLLEDVVLVTRCVLSLARKRVDVMPGVGCHLGQRLQGCIVCHGGCAIVVRLPQDWMDSAFYLPTPSRRIREGTLIGKALESWSAVVGVALIVTRS
jgi:hypothetical protein